MEQHFSKMSDKRRSEAVYEYIPGGRRNLG
jgi:hypothetical protein